MNSIMGGIDALNSLKPDLEHNIQPDIVVPGAKSKQKFIGQCVGMYVLMHVPPCVSLP